MCDKDKMRFRIKRERAQRQQHSRMANDKIITSVPSGLLILVAFKFKAIEEKSVLLICIKPRSIITNQPETFSVDCSSFYFYHGWSLWGFGIFSPQKERETDVEMLSGSSHISFWSIDFLTWKQMKGDNKHACWYKTPQILNTSAARIFLRSDTLLKPRHISDYVSGKRSHKFHDVVKVATYHTFKCVISCYFNWAKAWLSPLSDPLLACTP